MVGQIEYRPDAEGGSVFRVALPLPAVARPTVEPALRAADASRSVLLVKDDPVAQEVTAALLRSLGHRVSIAGYGGLALVLAGGSDFDLVLMDMQLGAASGVEVARAIRGLPGKAGAVRIVALSAGDLDDGATWGRRDRRRHQEAVHPAGRRRSGGGCCTVGRTLESDGAIRQ